METSETTTTTLSEEAAAAKAEFETTNEFEVVDAAQDLYAYDEEAIQKELSARKWKTEYGPHTPQASDTSVHQRTPAYTSIH